MLTLIVSVLIASLLGSLHCAGMCGAFVVIAVGMDRGMLIRMVLVVVGVLCRRECCIRRITAAGW